MFGARAGGLRETESLALEMGECYLPPDSEAGSANEERIELELKEKYFKLPPKKRENYIKLGFNSPFSCPWKLLLKDWTNKPVDDFYVLRDETILDDWQVKKKKYWLIYFTAKQFCLCNCTFLDITCASVKLSLKYLHVNFMLQECLKRKKNINCIQQTNKTNSCLVAVYLSLPAGNLQRNALICLPKPGDVPNVKALFEPPHKDPNEMLRRQLREEHVKTLKKLRKLRVKQRKRKPKPDLLVDKVSYLVEKAVCIIQEICQ